MSNNDRNTMQFLDFRNIPKGTLVKRSKHHKEQMQQRVKDQIGIITGVNFYEEFGTVIAYPEIHWEGELFSKITHPIHVEPYRKIILKLRTVTIPDEEVEDCQ